MADGLVPTTEAPDATTPVVHSRPCACGCGALVRTANPHALYAEGRCKSRAARRRGRARPRSRKRWRRVCWCGCKRRFRTTGQRRYLDERHKKRAENRRHRLKRQKATAERRAARVYIGTFLIEELRREVPDGLCIYCERTLTSPQRFICRRKDADGDSCLRQYNADWRRGQRMKLRQAGRAPLAERAAKP